MSTLNVNELLMILINIPSESGDEAGIGQYLFDHLRSIGFEVNKRTVDGTRCNIFATVGTPRIILQAHMDVVPPHIQASEDDQFIYGRGACDTKGSIASMLIASERAVSQKISDFGLLFTVGEETDFAGVKQIQQEIEALNAFIVVGEPTKLKPVSAHFGIITFLVICTGKAAHSSDPSMGENAIDKLVTLLSGPISTLKVHEESLLSLVQISGGVADNIIPDQAEALFSCRISPNDMRDYVQEVQQLVGEQAQVKKVLDIPSVASSVPESLSFLGDGQTVKYGTELSFLKNGIVFGPGNIADAHGPDERIKKADLGLAVEAYQNMLKQY